jgi:N-methylhydantoinase B
MSTRSTTSVELDPVDIAVLSHRFTAIVRKMSNTLLRAGRSFILNTGRDFSCCVLSQNDEILAVAESIPIHLLSGPDMMSRSMHRLHPEVKRGDAFLHNSPYDGNSHPADLGLLVPVFDDEGRHRFTVLSKAHVADIGNAVPTAYSAAARDVYEEGALIFPCVRVQEDYRDIEDIIRMCKVRIRAPDKWWGDYLALVGSARVGERELQELAEEVGWERLGAFVGRWLDYSESMMADALDELSPGQIVVRSCHDGFGPVPDGIPINVRLEVGGGRVVVDLRDNPECQPCGLNTTEATARSAALLGVFNAINGRAPANSGSCRRVDVLLRENCVVGIPRHPVSCSVATCNLPDRIGNAVQRGLAELSDGSGLAEVGLSQPASVGVLSGKDPRHGDEVFIDQLILGWTGGPGGPVADGWLTMGGIGDAGVLQRDSVELDEIRFPVRIESHRLLADTEGPGRRRGAPAAEATITVVAGNIEVVYLSDGSVNPAEGARGGSAGAPASQELIKADGRFEELPLWGQITLHADDTLVSRCCGGGGYGDPTAREPDRVALDVREGLVSRKRAHDVYRVVIDAQGKADMTATLELRQPNGAADPAAAVQ